MGNESCFDCRHSGRGYCVIHAPGSESSEREKLIGKLEAQLAAFEFTIRSCPCCKTRLSLCGKHGLYVTTDENVCPACWRGK